MTLFKINKLTSTTSTNDDAKKAAEYGAAAGTVFWALQQNAGRGRHGRQWNSPVGNLYFSVILRPKLPMPEWGKYGLLASLAVAETISKILLQAAVEIKWPNDVLVEDKKISGILLESGEGWLVVGIGMNVVSVPENPLYPTTCLVMENKEMNLSVSTEQRAEDFLQSTLLKILEALFKWQECMDFQGFSVVREEWLRFARKGQMRVRMPQEEVHGIFAGLDENGNLRLLQENGNEKIVHTGDVFPL